MLFVVSCVCLQKIGRKQTFTVRPHNCASIWSANLSAIDLLPQWREMYGDNLTAAKVNDDDDDNTSDMWMRSCACVLVRMCAKTNQLSFAPAH